jgi:hypothetical protein
MAQITRSTKVGGGTTLQSNTLARAADVETDILTLFTAHNNADDGSAKWQVGSFENAASTVVVANNSTGINDILDVRDNGTSVLKVVDGGSTTVRATDGGTSKALIVNNGTSTGNILEAQDNGTAALTLADGGTLTFAPGGTTKVVGNSSGLTLSNSATIAMGSAKITGLASGAANNEAAHYGQMKVLQVVQATSTTAFSSTSGSFVNTNLSGSITPVSASNKILIIVCSAVRTSATTVICYVEIARGSTSITGTDGFAKFSATGITGESWAPCTGVFLDSPATTSNTTYNVRIRNSNGSTTVAFGESNQQQAMILMEVNGI